MRTLSQRGVTQPDKGMDDEFDDACQIMETKKEKTATEAEHQAKAAEYTAIQDRLAYLLSDIPRTIKRAKYVTGPADAPAQLTHSSHCFDLLVLTNERVVYSFEVHCSNIVYFVT